MNPAHVLHARAESTANAKSKGREHRSQRPTLGMKRDSSAQIHGPNASGGGRPGSPFPGDTDPRQEVVSGRAFFGQLLGTVRTIVPNGLSTSPTLHRFGV